MAFSETVVAVEPSGSSMCSVSKYSSILLAVAQIDRHLLERRRERVRATRDSRQPVGPVIDPVHCGHVRQQCLSGADVRGSLLAADVLLASLQCHPIGRVAMDVNGHADDASRRLPDERLPRGEKRSVRPADIPSARPSVARCRRRRRRPFRRAARQASARADRRRPRRARSESAPE